MEEIGNAQNNETIPNFWKYIHRRWEKFKPCVEAMNDVSNDLSSVVEFICIKSNRCRLNLTLPKIAKWQFLLSKSVYTHKKNFLLSFIWIKTKVHVRLDGFLRSN